MRIAVVGHTKVVEPLELRLAISEISSPISMARG